MRSSSITAGWTALTASSAARPPDAHDDVEALELEAGRHRAADRGVVVDEQDDGGRPPLSHGGPARSRGRPVAGSARRCRAPGRTRCGPATPSRALIVSLPLPATITSGVAGGRRADAVVAGAADEDVGAAAADERVAPGVAGEQVVAGPADEAVVARAADEAVVAAPAVDAVAPPPPSSSVVAPAPVDRSRRRRRRVIGPGPPCASPRRAERARRRAGRCVRRGAWPGCTMTARPMVPQRRGRTLTVLSRSVRSA